jgi:hypothetical protein
MGTRLQEIISDARRELRKASGLALTPEQQLEERQKVELWAMNKFLANKFDIHQRLELNLTAAIAGDQSVVATFLVEDRHFRLVRNSNKECNLLLIDSAGDRELTHLSEDDPQFANKILVAIGDNLSSRA